MAAASCVPFPTKAEISTSGVRTCAQPSPVRPARLTPVPNMRHLGLFSLLGIAAVHAACSAGSGSTTNPNNATGGAAAAGGSTSAGSGGIVVDPFGGSVSNSGSGGSGTPAYPWPPDPPPWKTEADGSLSHEEPGATGAAAKFQTKQTGDGLPLQYPLDNTLTPANLGKMTFQWSGGGGQLFRIQAKTKSGKTFNLYAPANCSPQCQYSPPPEFWIDIGVQSGGEPVEITLASTSAAGGSYTEGPPITVLFTKEPLLGAVYFWATATDSVMRANMESPEKAVPFIAPNSATNRYACTGCHSVSRNGKVISFGISSDDRDATSANSAIQSASVEDPTQKYIEPKGAPTHPDLMGHMPALNPSGDFLVYSVLNPVEQPPTGPQFRLVRAQTGEVVQKIIEGDALVGAGMMPAHPEWSPDGKWVAISLSDRSGACSSPDVFMVCNGSIAIMPFDGAKLGAPKIVATSTTDYLFYPTWSPDGKYLAFAHHAKGSSTSQFGRTDTTISMVPVDGAVHSCPDGNTCYSFRVGGNNGKASWPKFTPFGPVDGKYLFMSITSNENYGNIVYGQSSLWMFGIDLTKLQTPDASFAPVWLPQQTLPTNLGGNLQAIWTQKLPCNAQGGEATCKGCVAGERCKITATECSCVSVPPQ